MKKFYSPIFEMYLMMWHWLWGHPVKNADSKLRQLMQRHARLTAELEYHASMAKFYADDALMVDPEQDWNRFADLKNNWHNHDQEAQVISQRRQALYLRYQACRHKVDRMRNQGQSA